MVDSSENVSMVRQNVPDKCYYFLEDHSLVLGLDRLCFLFNQRGVGRVTEILNKNLYFFITDSDSVGKNKFYSKHCFRFLTDDAVIAKVKNVFKKLLVLLPRNNDVDVIAFCFS